MNGDDIDVVAGKPYREVANLTAAV